MWKRSQMWMPINGSWSTKDAGLSSAILLRTPLRRYLHPRTAALVTGITRVVRLQRIDANEPFERWRIQQRPTPPLFCPARKNNEVRHVRRGSAHGDFNCGAVVIRCPGLPRQFDVQRLCALCPFD